MRIRKIFLINLLSLLLCESFVLSVRAMTFTVERAKTMVKNYFLAEILSEKSATQKQIDIILSQRAIAFNRVACYFSSGDYMAFDLLSLKKLVEDALVREIFVVAVQLSSDAYYTDLYYHELLFISVSDSVGELFLNLRNLADAYIDLNRENL